MHFLRKCIKNFKVNLEGSKTCQLIVYSSLVLKVRASTHLSVLNQHVGLNFRSKLVLASAIELKSIMEGLFWDGIFQMHFNPETRPDNPISRLHQQNINKLSLIWKKSFSIKTFPGTCLFVSLTLLYFPLLPVDLFLKVSGTVNVNSCSELEKTSGLLCSPEFSIGNMSETADPFET